MTSLHWQAGLQNNVVHFAHLAKQASVGLSQTFVSYKLGMHQFVLGYTWGLDPNVGHHCHNL